MQEFFFTFSSRIFFAATLSLLYECYIKAGVISKSRKIVIANKFISGKWQNKMVAKIVGLQYIIELFTWMNADPYLHFFFSLEWPWNTILLHQLLKVKGKIADVGCMRISIQNRNSTGHHVSISNGFHFVDVVLFNMVIEQTATQTHQYRSEPT